MAFAAWFLIFITAMTGCFISSKKQGNLAYFKDKANLAQDVVISLIISILAYFFII